MSLLQFWRILRARWWFILVTTLSCLSGAYAATLVVPPRWEARSRVLLNLVKPDPATGEMSEGSGTRTYVASQLELIRDYSVAGLVVDRKGLLWDRDMILKYQARPPSDHRDFRHWIAQIVIDHTKADAVEGSNILEITYTAKTAERARAMADALRRAYLDTSLSLRRADAKRSADWYSTQAARAKAALDQAEMAEAEYERTNKVFMATDTMDLDSARLAMLATQPGVTRETTASSPVSAQVAELDSELAQMSKTLGPNHPQLQALRAKRASLLGIVARERVRMASVGDAGGTRSALDSEAALVSSKYGKVAKLKQLHAEVVLRRDLYNKTAARAAEFRQQAAVTDVGLTPLGATISPAAPAFPNMFLILFGSLTLGTLLGVAIALLVELLHRRIRGQEDLQLIADAPLLAVLLTRSRSQ